MNKTQEALFKLDPKLANAPEFGPTITAAIEMAMNLGVTAVFNPSDLPPRRVNLHQTARNILDNPRPDELEELNKLTSDEDKLNWALGRAMTIAREAGFVI